MTKTGTVCSVYIDKATVTHTHYLDTYFCFQAEASTHSGINMIWFLPTRFSNDSLPSFRTACLTITPFRVLLPTTKIGKVGIRLNIFYDRDSFVGKAEVAHLNRCTQEFIELAGTIRRKLGKQGYLLDKYVATILEGINATLIFTSANEGFYTATELHQLCVSVMNAQTDYIDHPLYGKAKEYIESNPLSYQENHTKIAHYGIALTGDFLDYAAEKFAAQQREAISAVFDIVNLRNMYRRISSILGDENEMERLNLLMRQRFLIVTPMTGFLQGLANDLIYLFLERDFETSKQAFQLMLDEKTG